jgi:hypothetical protein
MSIEIPTPSVSEPTPAPTTTRAKKKEPPAELAKIKETPIDILLDKFDKYTDVQKQVAFLEVLSRQPPTQWLKNTDDSKPDNKFMKNKQTGKLIPYLDLHRMYWLSEVLLLNLRWGEPKFTFDHITQGEAFFVDQNGTQHRNLTTFDYCVVTIPLTYYNHGTQTDIVTSGVAAVETGRGNEQIHMVIPKALAEAKKSAMKSIGNIFGRSLDRSELVITEDDVPFTRAAAKQALMEGLE